MDSSMIYCLGNTNYDIVFDPEGLRSGTPGGSKLNTAVSLGRMHLPVSFISRVGKDELGTRIASFLKKNNVDTSRFFLNDGYKTNLALAFLDEERNASYLHYGSEDTSFQIPQISFQSRDYLLFGSVFAIAKPTDEIAEKILKQAASANALRIYDPNMRKKIRLKHGNYAEMALKRIQQAHIIKLSDEDLHAMNISLEYLKRHSKGKYLIITRREKEVLFFSEDLELGVKPAAIRPVSTIGAGDGFNAGLIAALHRTNITAETLTQLTAEDWKRVIAMGNEVAGNVCMQKENYISVKHDL